MKAAAPVLEEEKKTDAPEKKKTTDAGHFADLQSIWQRPWPDDEREARKAFAEACQHADPDEIIAGARAWAEHHHDEPRFLKPLHKWLAARGWTKPPPPKSQKKRQSGHRSLGDAMREAGERRAAKEADGGFLNYGNSDT